MTQDPRRRPPPEGDTNTGTRVLTREDERRRNVETGRTGERDDKALPNADTISEAQS